MSGRRPPIAALLAGLAVVTGLAVAGCGINADADPRVIPEGQRVRLALPDADAAEATGGNRVYVLTEGREDGQRLLRSVPRDVSSNREVLQALFDGPNRDEIEAGLGTALPPDVRLLAVRELANNLIVDVSSEILELPSTALRRAIAQIVFTAAELDGVRAVRLRVDGEIRNWPDGSGQLTSEALTVYDFPGYVEWAQPAYPAVPSNPAA